MSSNRDTKERVDARVGTTVQKSKSARPALTNNKPKISIVGPKSKAPIKTDKGLVKNPRTGSRDASETSHSGSSMRSRDASEKSGSSSATSAKGKPVEKGDGPKKVIIKKDDTTSYECLSRLGKGSFGIVYKAMVTGTTRVVAIKRTLEDPKYKNRELQIMKSLDHPNVVQYVDSFYEKIKGEIYLNLIMGYSSKNLYEVIEYYNKRKEQMPVKLAQLYVYQLLRGLAYVHSKNMAHRDIKPQNLLIDVHTNVLRICDFGSAKIMVAGEPNVAYICSRYYRAPELIFEATHYSFSVDVWSAGCVMAELFLGTPIFPGESGVHQLVEIIKVLGTPTREEILNMNKDYKDEKQFPVVKAHPFSKLFPSGTPSSALDLLSNLLVYTPSKRLKPLEACCHKFFNPLRVAFRTNPKSLPNLFDLTTDELTYSFKHGIMKKLLGQSEESQPKVSTKVDDGVKRSVSDVPKTSLSLNEIIVGEVGSEESSEEKEKQDP